MWWNIAEGDDPSEAGKEVESDKKTFSSFQLIRKWSHYGIFCRQLGHVFIGPESDDCLALSVTNSCFWDLIHYLKLDVVAVTDINFEDSVDKRLLAANSLAIAWRKLFIVESKAATFFSNADS